MKQYAIRPQVQQLPAGCTAWPGCWHSPNTAALGRAVAQGAPVNGPISVQGSWRVTLVASWQATGNCSTSRYNQQTIYTIIRIRIRTDCAPLQKSCILLGPFTYCTSCTWQSFNGRLYRRSEQELQKKHWPQKINVALHHIQVRHSCYAMSTYIKQWGAAIPAEQKAAADPSTRTGFIPAPWAAPALPLTFHMLLMKFGSAKCCSCTPFTIRQSDPVENTWSCRDKGEKKDSINNARPKAL